jgi:signal transduction histidine kinase
MSRPGEGWNALGVDPRVEGLPRRVRSALAGVRTRAVVWFLLMFGLALVVLVLTVRQLLVASVDREVRSGLVQEVDELRLLARSVDPATGEPFGEDVAAIFDTYLAQNFPDTGEAFFVLVAGAPYTSSSGAPADLFADAGLVARWAELDRPLEGESVSPAGPVRWLAVPLGSGDEVVGTFVVTRFTQERLAAIDRQVQAVAWVSGVMLLVAGVLSWFAAGTVTAPVRRLTRTAREVGGSDLTARIPVRGHDEVAELTDTFNQMMGRLEASFSTQRDFLNDVGHDLRTPITIVRGHLETLPDDPGEREATIALCLDELDRMGRYVSDLLLLATSGRPDFLVVEPVDLTDLTWAMVARGRSLAPDRGWRADDVAAAVIEADPQRLTQAWLNLVTNAIRHTEPGHDIALGSSVQDGWAAVWVRDTGPGIAAEDRERIFERFGRGRGSTTGDGTGLGLAIVTAIVEAHGGHVELDSPPGAGATFRIVVPTAPPGPGPGPQHDDRAGPAASLRRPARLLRRLLRHRPAGAGSQAGGDAPAPSAAHRSGERPPPGQAGAGEQASRAGPAAAPQQEPAR